MNSSQNTPKEGAGVPVVAWLPPEHELRHKVGDFINASRTQKEGWDPVYRTPPPVMPAAPSDAVTDAMVDAYLKANDAYWKQTDQLPSPPDKWRTGTPREATRVSLAAALSQTMQPQAEPAAGEQAGAVAELGIARDRTVHRSGCPALRDAVGCTCAAAGAAIAAREQEGRRTPQDYAIEHAEYMATTAEGLIEAVNDLAKAEQERDDGSANPSDVDAAQETVSEYLGTLRNRIYEFRKRRDRALASPKEAPSTPQGETLTGLHLAVIGRRHFGNPIPAEWYSAARELETALTQPTTVQQAEPIAWAVVYQDGSLATKDGVFTDKEKAQNCCDYMSASFSDMSHPVVRPLLLGKTAQTTALPGGNGEAQSEPFKPLDHEQTK